MPAGTIGNVTGMARNRLRTEESAARSPDRGSPGRDKREPQVTIQKPGRRLPSPRGGGRAWINGREVGGGDRRYIHLSASYD